MPFEKWKDGLMANIACPHCHQLTIPAWRKLLIGPGSPATCKSCGGKVGVPWSSSLLAFSPFFGALLIWSFVVPKILLLVGGAAAMVLLYHFYVPLIRK